MSEEEKEEKEKRKMYQRIAVYSGIPMTLLSGVLVGYGIGYLLDGFVNFSDITQPKQAEEVLCKGKDELELRLRERTAGLKAKARDLGKISIELEAKIVKRKRLEKGFKHSTK